MNFKLSYQTPISTVFIFFLILSIGSGSLLAIEEPIQLTFHQLLRPKGVFRGEVSALQSELAAYHQKEVVIRGFLYQGHEGQWIIASEPNLRTCCVGATGKVAQQIILNDSFVGGEQQRVIALQGRFLVEPIWGDDGSLKQLYRMDQVAIHPDPPYAWSSIIVVVAILGISCAAYAWYIRRA